MESFWFRILELVVGIGNRDSMSAVVLVVDVRYSMSQIYVDKIIVQRCSRVVVSVGMVFFESKIFNKGWWFVIKMNLRLYKYMWNFFIAKMMVSVFFFNCV